MLAALQHDGPVLFLEHKLLSELWLEFMGSGGRRTVKYDVPPDGAVSAAPRRWSPVPIGKAIVRREGSDVTIVSVGVGAHRALLRTEDVRIIKEMRNEVNRLVNAETANLQKTAEAAALQVAAVRAVEQTRGLDTLPPALREIALLRLEFPEVSLRELGELADPPLSKSAVYHRIRRLEELAQDG